MGDRVCMKWWEVRTNFEKTLLSLSIILFLTCIIFILVGVVKHSDINGNDGVCDTKLCIETAGDILSKGNFDANPCEDFYEYACGKYARSHSISSDGQPVTVADETANAVLLRLKAWLESKSSNSSSANSKANTLFSSCMYSDQQPEKPVETLRKAFLGENLGRWPLITDLWSDDTDRLEPVMASLILLSIPAVAQMEVLPDSQEGKFIVKLSPGLPFSKKQNDGRVSQYIESALALLGIPMKLVSSKSDDILTTESQVWHLKHKSDYECLKYDRLDRELGIVKLGSLKDVNDTILHSRVNWTDILSLVFLNSSVAPTHPLEIYCKRHIREFSDSFYTDSPKRVHNYFGWRFFLSLMPYLSPKLRQLHQENLHLLYTGEKETSRQIPKWKSCVSLVEQYMLPVLVNFYRNDVVTENLLKEKTTIAASVRMSLSELISESEWLAGGEKRFLQQKIESSKFELPPSKLLDSRKLDSWFDDLNFDDDLVKNVLQLMKFKTHKSMRRIVAPMEDYLEWDEASIVTSDRFLGKENYLPIGFDKIRRPYLSTEQQNYMNYGAFGTHLGRQLNLFMNTLDMKEALRPNTSVWDIFESQEKQDNCLLSTEKSDTDQNAEDKTEALIELSSIHASYGAYQKQRSSESRMIGLDLSEDKIFFLSYAQSMCEAREDSGKVTTKFSAKEKVNFALRNFDAFSSSYECPHNAAMNPSKKCELWN